MDIGKSVNKYLFNCFNDILTQFFDFLSQVLFEPKAMPEFFKNMYLIFLGIGAMLMTCIVLFKVIQYMIDVSNDQRPLTIGEIITRTIKASFMIMAMPALLDIVVGQIVYPLGEYMFTQIGSNLAKTTADYITSVHVGALLENKEGIVFIVTFGFITVAVGCYFFKMCVYHADLILLQIFSIPAAISMCADDNNYMGVWWREFISQIVTVLAETLLMSGVVTILGGTHEWYTFMILIGCCCSLIRGPHFLRSMWYSSGTKSPLMQGGKLAARFFLMGKGQ